MDRIRKLTFWTAAATLGLIAWGGLVRATGSGDGCPDWPRCFGKWTPPVEYHALIEYTHRLLVNVVVLLIAILAVTAFRRYRNDRRILWPAAGGVVLVLVQSVLGGIVVNTGLNSTMVTAHFATALLLIGTQVYLLVNTYFVEPAGDAPSRTPVTPSFAYLTALTAAATFALLLVGAYVRGTNAGLAFADWPLMNGRLVPALEGLLALHFVHRVLAASVFLLVLYMGVRVWVMPTRPPAVTRLAASLAGLFVAQILVGAANVWTRLSAAAIVAHLTLSALIWAAALALATLSGRLALPQKETAGADARAERRSLRDSATAYFRLTKPRIIVLLLITTVPAMVLAQGGMPSGWLVLATLAGGSVAAGSANSINCYLDRDIDAVMRRTRRRPLPARDLDPERALTFGFALGAVSFFFLAVTVNVLAAALALSAIAFYVFVYTLWLKRNTAQNIVIGGAAGAMPALIGWAAVTGDIGFPALVLFAIVLVWTPPHFWALAMQYATDYRIAGVPMMPVVRGEQETRRQILLYSLALFVVSLVLFPVAGMGPVYLISAVVLGGMFIWRALKLWRTSTPALAVRLFKFSILYLAALFAAVAADRLIPLPA